MNIFQFFKQTITIIFSAVLTFSSVFHPVHKTIIKPKEQTTTVKIINTPTPAVSVIQEKTGDDLGVDIKPTLTPQPTTSPTVLPTVTTINSTQLFIPTPTFIPINTPFPTNTPLPTIYLQNQINNNSLNMGNSGGSGGCSDHGGVNCPAGPQPNGKVICTDGWTGSSVDFNSVTECGTQYNSKIEAALNQLNQTLSNIYHQGADVPMNVVEGQSQQAYQNWIRNNQSIYTFILGNTYYSNRLRTILASYGL